MVEAEGVDGRSDRRHESVVRTPEMDGSSVSSTHERCDLLARIRNHMVASSGRVGDTAGEVHGAHLPGSVAARLVDAALI